MFDARPSQSCETKIWYQDNKWLILLKQNQTGTVGGQTITDGKYLKIINQVETTVRICMYETVQSQGCNRHSTKRLLYNLQEIVCRRQGVIRPFTSARITSTSHQECSNC